MPFLLELPDQYGYVLAVATSTFFLNSLHVWFDSKHRKASGLKYPIAYASAEQAQKDPAAFKFNCAQRAHANFTENQTSFLGALLIAGLRFPFASALIGASWVLFRTQYVFGYTSARGPQGRELGAIGHFLTDAALKFMAAYASYVMIAS